MICLSKADKHALRHLSFNQSPPALAASSTTRQDLNGISKLREHVDADQEDGNGISGSGSSSNLNHEKCLPDNPPPGLKGSLADAGRQSCGIGLSSLSKAFDGGDDHNRLSRAVSKSYLSVVWSWTTWLLSIIALSYQFSRYLPSQPALATSAPFPSPAASVSFNPGTLKESPPLTSPSRKRSTCASGGVDKKAYNLPLHVGALMIIWFVSTLACVFPILATKFPGLRIPARFFFAVRHFGTGVLIATAFVHLLPTAFVSLGNQCLDGFWTQDYPAMPGAIALAAIFFVTVIEMVFHPGRHVPPAQMTTSGNGVEQTNDQHRHGGGCMGSANMLMVREKGPLRGRSSSVGQRLANLDRANESDEQAVEENEPSRGQPNKDVEDSAVETYDPMALSSEQQQRKELLQCVLLEMGILFHSVFIGMALSVSIGNEFIVLLIAISFHQTFEGLALGSRIAAVKWPQGQIQPWLMALAYGCTTPLGQAIGIATHTLYSPDSEVGLILVGVMNAISAGLLTFASLVELLSEDFLSDESWRHLRGKKRVIACILVFLGAFFMALVGAWA